MSYYWQNVRETKLIYLESTTDLNEKIYRDWNEQTKTQRFRLGLK